MEASALEQDIACSDNKQEHYKNVCRMVQSTSISNIERLRLVLLYALKYEGDSSVAQLKKLLLDANISEDQVGLVDQLLRYAGQHVRSVDLFQNKSWSSYAKSTLQRHVQGVENVYTQHKSHLAGV